MAQAKAVLLYATAFVVRLLFQSVRTGPTSVTPVPTSFMASTLALATHSVENSFGTRYCNIRRSKEQAIELPIKGVGDAN